MMSTLKRRIVAQAPGNDLTIVGTLNGPTALPMTRVTMHPGTLGYENLQYAVTADGAPVVAVPQGGFGTLVKAGHP